MHSPTKDRIRRFRVRERCSPLLPAATPPDRKADPHARWNRRDHLIRKSEDIDTGDFRAWLDAQVPLDRLKTRQYDEHRCGFVRHHNFLPPDSLGAVRDTEVALKTS